MPVIENLKNFIRHGKQARAAAEPHPQPAPVHHAHSDLVQNNEPAQPTRKAEYAEDPTNNQTIVPQADAATANATAAHQKPQDDPSIVTRGHGGISSNGLKSQSGKGYDPEVLAKIIAEEKESKVRLPRYPGLERWTLIEKMGDGAFSNVYKARDNMGEYGEVAIKVVRKYELNASQENDHLHPDFKNVPKTVERANILKEVAIMRGLNHPNIVALISFSESQSYYYLVLELLSGGELFHQIVRLTYFSENLSRHVIVQVAEALRYLHEEKGVVHRDIKPENLLFEPIPFIPTKNPKPKLADEEDKADEGEFIPGLGAGGIGRIKVADFGLSKIVWDNQTMTPCGTVGYTAPEIVKDERYSKSVDMWALGCVLYTLLCGFPPFYDESITILTEKVAKGQYTFLSPWWDEISKSAQDLVSHLLTVDPEKRYTIEQFMAHPWIRQTDEETTAASDAPPLATPAPKVEGDTTMFVSPDFSPSMGQPGSVGTATTKRMDFRSPGAVSLREVFDVGYAVHRMEEEVKRRKNWKQGYRGVQPLNEEEEYDSDDEEEPAAKVPRDVDVDDVMGVEQSFRKASLGTANMASTYSGAVAAARGAQPRGTKVPVGPPGKAARRKQGGFELSLDNATLLGRRKRGEAGRETAVQS